MNTVTGTTFYTVSPFMKGYANGAQGRQISDASFMGATTGGMSISCTFTSTEIAMNQIWVVVAATLVLFMQVRACGDVDAHWPPFEGAGRGTRALGGILRRRE